MLLRTHDVRRCGCAIIYVQADMAGRDFTAERANVIVVSTGANIRGVTS